MTPVLTVCVCWPKSKSIVDYKERFDSLGRIFRVGETRLENVADRIFPLIAQLAPLRIAAASVQRGARVRQRRR